MQELKDFEIYILEKIIINTDFEKIHKMMVAVNWGWYSIISGENIFITPDVNNIKNTARRLISQLLINIRPDKEYCFHESGGLFVWYNQYNSDNWYENIILDFRLNTTLYLDENEIAEFERLEKLNELLSYINKKED